MAPAMKVVSIAVALILATPIITAPTGLAARQLAGEGSLFNSLFSDTDNGIGYGVENAEDNIAGLLGNSGSSTSAGAGGNAPKPPPRRRQGDKIANGAATLLSAAGAPDVANIVKTYGDNIDGELTDGAANLGAQLGSQEESTLEKIGGSVP